jgi:hypothetical protein
MDPKEQARLHRGVWYDSRAKKFAAEVYSCGERHFIGLFDSAAAAGAAYAEARNRLPVADRGGSSFQKVFEPFLDTVRRDAKGTPVIGSALVYDGQTFTFTGVAFRRRGKVRYPLYCWRSACTECGAQYETMTAANASAAGVTRRCEQHRRGRGAKRAADAVPSEWLDAARATVEQLSLVYESFAYDDFVVECHRNLTSATREDRVAFNRFLIRHKLSPVELREDDRFYRKG